MKKPTATLEGFGRQEVAVLRRSDGSQLERTMEVLFPFLPDSFPSGIFLNGVQFNRMSRENGRLIYQEAKEVAT